VIRENRIDLILTSLGGIYHTAITAYRLSQKFGIPYILEFRDLWDDYPFTGKTFYNKLLSRYYEKKTVLAADHIITSAPGMRTRLKQKYNLSENSISVITNGFDPADLNTGEDSSDNKDVLEMSFCGSMYTSITPVDLFKGLLRADLGNLRIRLNFIGNFRTGFWKIVSEFKPELKKKRIEIQVHPRMDYENMIRHLQRSDLLLVFLPDIKFTDSIYPTKIFDYIALKKPILAFCPKPSDLERFVNENNVGFVVKADDEKNSVEILNRIIEIHKQGDLKRLTATDSILKKYTRRSKTEDLVNIMNSIMGSR
jgi:glycosyltransferase involved in cell wall biosynthesis